jgi:hypothetical protein
MGGLLNDSGMYFRNMNCVPFDFMDLSVPMAFHELHKAVLILSESFDDDVVGKIPSSKNCRIKNSGMKCSSVAGRGYGQEEDLES